VSDPHPAKDDAFVEPSWLTARSEADAALRRLRQARTSMECVSRELAALEEWGEATARLDLAHALTDGPDGGPLNGLARMASDDKVDPSLRQTTRLLLERITSALGLEAVGERGDLLKLLPEEVAEFDVRGAPGDPAHGERELYCVVRPGWCLEEVIVARPLLERAPGPANGRDEGAPEVAGGKDE
jgi:hypothetical protein